VYIGLFIFSLVYFYRNEREAIEDIVGKVVILLDKTDLFVPDHLVGVKSRVHDMIQKLNIQQSNDVLLLGIWGMGGIGKTTIAKAIYNEISHNFRCRSFLANIRETWEHTDGKVSLQEQLLLDILKKTTTKIPNIESGKNTIKDMLCDKRVLLVLDDVDSLDQLNALCGSRKWFGSGTRIIIIKIIPNDEVQRKLKISYDGLNDDTEKEIFLDIACFFIGMDRNDVIQILNGCGLFAEIGISVLVERSLVTVDDKNTLGMHDLLRDMGREIIREKSPREPEERSRLWFHEDVLAVLSEQIVSTSYTYIGI